MEKMTFKYDKPVRVPAALAEYIKDQQKHPEPFITLPFDKEYVDVVKKAVKQFSAPRPANLVVAGIGGSNLGTQAIYEALKPKLPIYFAETLDARRLSRILDNLKRPVVLAIVSESGTTVETIANAAVLLARFKKGDRVAVITDEGTKLWTFADKKGFLRVPRPKKEVTGRYSVFSAVGLFPLALAGVKTDKLLAGAAGVTKACLSSKLAENPAAQSALAIYDNWKTGKFIHDTFIFEPDLEFVGRWYRQLTGESVGKNGEGITPTISIGTTDLHSVAQLYLGGPKDKFTTFISVKNHGADFKVPAGVGAQELVPDIAGKSFNKMLDAVLLGVKTTYRKQDLPFAEIELDDVSEESLGALLQMKLIEMTYLGKLMGVNPFDEPEVDLYKNEVRKLLKQL